MLGRRLPHAHETILLKHRLKTEDAERNRQAKAEQAELNRIQRERENRQKADAARNAAIEKQHAEKERSMYGTPETEYQGGNNLSADTLWVKHYATPLPIAALPHPSDPEYSEAPVCFAPGLMRARNGNLSGDAEWMSQAKDTKKVWDEIKGRYST